MLPHLLASYTCILCSAGTTNSGSIFCISPALAAQLLPLNSSLHGNIQYLIFGYLWQIQGSMYNCSKPGHTRNDPTSLEHQPLKVSHHISLLQNTVRDFCEHSMWSTGKSDALPPTRGNRVNTKCTCFDPRLVVASAQTTANRRQHRK